MIESPFGEPSVIPAQYLGTINPDIQEGPPTVISLFSGCGGFDVGSGWAGFETRVMVEWDKSCCETLRANFTRAGWSKHRKDRPNWLINDNEPAILEADITKTTTREILDAGRLQVGEATLLTGGFPCQGFSHAGKRLLDDPRNRLYRECVRVIREALPKTFCLENVPGLATMGKGRVIHQICHDLADSGYEVNWDILNAADYGVPQNRRRILFIGKRIDILSFVGERPRLVIAAVKGGIHWPEFFKKKYPDLVK